MGVGLVWDPGNRSGWGWGSFLLMVFFFFFLNGPGLNFDSRCANCPGGGGLLKYDLGRDVPLRLGK